MATDRRTACRWRTALTVFSAGVAVTAGTAVVAQPAGAAPTVHSSLSSSVWGDTVEDVIALTGKGKNAAGADPESLYTVETAIGAREVWKLKDPAKRQLTGQGVTVALLDSGTAAVPGLTGTGKLSYGPDLSIEGNGVLSDQDTFGHGTHLAGLIAGRDTAVLTDKTIDSLDPSVQLGVAPDANLLSMKLATTDGSSGVSQVIAWSAARWSDSHWY